MSMQASLKVLLLTQQRYLLGGRGMVACKGAVCSAAPISKDLKKIRFMKIELKKLTLTNFKGIRSFSTGFNQVTNICGDNATGKTTLKDAFLWLFFGKDSSDRKDFEIKTLDENNQPFHKLDHEVEAIINLDGEELNIRRSMREKWVKKRGEQEAIFSGHETSFFWNEVPLKEGEFQAKVANVFNENIFKLITNTDYFNSLKWQDRRGVLMQLGGAISNDEVFEAIITPGNKGNFTALINALTQKKSVDEFKKEIAAKKKKLKDELELLPARIDEANRSLPEPKDYDVLLGQIAQAQIDIENIESLLQSKSKAQKDYQDNMLAITKEIGQLKQQALQIEFNEANKVQDSKRNREQVILFKKRELNTMRDDKSRLTADYLNEERRKINLVAEKTELVTKWESINAEQLVFDEKEFHCPACKRAYEATDVEAKKVELVHNFNGDKSRRLADVTGRGKTLADEIKVIEAKLGNIAHKGQALNEVMEVAQNDMVALEEEHNRLLLDEQLHVNDAIRNNTEYKAIQEMITLRNEEVTTKLPDDNNSDLVSRKRTLQLEIDDWKKQLSGKDQRERILARIKELNEQESTMAQELASLEGTEFSIEQFIKAKMDTLESRINGRFKIVRFKLFEEQINGGQVEACTTLINGVPYADANTAAKIQAGLDIINTLSDHYDTYGPVWVDNRESVIRLPETKSQLINLIVSEKHKKLTVLRTEEMAMA